MDGPDSRAGSDVQHVPGRAERCPMERPVQGDGEEFVLQVEAILLCLESHRMELGQTHNIHGHYYQKPRRGMTGHGHGREGKKNIPHRWGESICPSRERHTSGRSPRQGQKRVRRWMFRSARAGALQGPASATRRGYTRSDPGPGPGRTRSTWRLETDSPGACPPRHIAPCCCAGRPHPCSAALRGYPLVDLGSCIPPCCFAGVRLVVLGWKESGERAGRQSFNRPVSHLLIKYINNTAAREDHPVDGSPALGYTYISDLVGDRAARKAWCTIPSSEGLHRYVAFSASPSSAPPMDGRRKTSNTQSDPNVETEWGVWRPKRALKRHMSMEDGCWTVMHMYVSVCTYRRCLGLGAGQQAYINAPWSLGGGEVADDEVRAAGVDCVACTSTVLGPEVNLPRLCRVMRCLG